MKTFFVLVVLSLAACGPLTVNVNGDVNANANIDGNTVNTPPVDSKPAPTEPVERVVPEPVLEDAGVAVSPDAGEAVDAGEGEGEGEVDAGPVGPVDPPCVLPDGDLTIGAYPEQLDAMSGCTVVKGSLTVVGGSLNGLYGLRSLVEVQGDLLVSGLDATDLHLGKLARVGGMLQISSDPFITHLGLDSLQSVGGFFVVVNNYGLSVCEADGLATKLGKTDGVDYFRDDGAVCR